MFGTNRNFGSSDVRMHVATLVSTADDASRLRDGMRRTSEALDAVVGHLQSAAAHFDSLDLICTSLCNHVVDAVNTSGDATDLATKLRDGVPVGLRIATSMERLERQLVAAEKDIENRQAAYRDAAMFDGTPILGTVERNALRPIGELHDDVTRAVATRDGILEDLDLLRRIWIDAVFVACGIGAPSEGHFVGGGSIRDVDADGPAAGRYALWTEGFGFAGLLMQSSSEPRIDEVLQGGIGDCYFAASIAALADTPNGVRYLQSMIRDNGDGTYTVTFSRGREITVDSVMFTEANGNLSAARMPRDGSFWFLVLEKAYASLKGSYSVIGQGGNAADALDEIGLGGTTSYLSTMSDTDLRAALSDAAGGRPVVASMMISDVYEGYSDDSGSHAFTVVDFDPMSDTVTVRNPWGNNPSRLLPSGSQAVAGTGTISMPYSSFRETCYRIAVAERMP